MNIIEKEKWLSVHTSILIIAETIGVALICLIVEMFRYVAVYSQKKQNFLSEHLV